jgi:hypothetical protein
VTSNAPDRSPFNFLRTVPDVLNFPTIIITASEVEVNEIRIIIYIYNKIVFAAADIGSPPSALAQRAAECKSRKKSDQSHLRSDFAAHAETTTQSDDKSGNAKNHCHGELL